MPYIKSAQVQLACYSPSRTKPTMSAKALREAFEKGADFYAYSIDGQPSQVYCSCRDFAAGATVEIVERNGPYLTTVAYFTYNPPIDPQANDIPAFANGHPIELD